jgi:hypothetical protein
VIQTDLDTLVLKIVREPAFGDAELELIRREVSGMFGPTIKLVVEFVDTIPLTKAGKLRMTISHVGDR